MGTPELQVLLNENQYEPFVYEYEEKEELIHVFKKLLEFEMNQLKNK